jgi:polyferredoxin
VAGFFLLVAPFALLTRGVFLLTGNAAEPDLHSLCFRMPLDWLFSGNTYYFTLSNAVRFAFVFGVLALAFVAGAVFCGWLCPVGAVSEAVSRVIPLPRRLRVKIHDTTVTSGLRYGFLLGFIAVAAIVGQRLIQEVSSICCRYCASSQLQNLASALFGNAEAVAYWHTGAILVLGFWLLVGGLFFVGGRGWCLFFCPLGAFSNLVHRIGSKLGLYRITFDRAKCQSCSTCQVDCPTWAITEAKQVDPNLCIACQECTHACIGGAYRYQKGGSP